MHEAMWHPMVVHFPIALLAILPLLKLGDSGLLPKLFAKGSITKVYYVIFGIGLGSFVLSLFLGDIASETAPQAKGHLAKITNHEDWAYFALYGYLGVAIIEWLQVVVEEQKDQMPLGKILMIFYWVALVASTYCLFETGHRGALLVYEFGVGVQP